VKPVDQQAKEERLARGQPILTRERRPGEDLEQRGDPVDPCVDPARRDRSRQA